VSTATNPGWRARLLTDTPRSRREAKLGQLYRGWLQFKRNRLAVLGLAIVIALVLTAAFAPWIATHSPYEQNLAQRLLPPGTPGHWLGTDEFGRDIFSRIVYGARVTLYIVVLVALIAAPIGLIVGTAAGYLGGWVDAALMRITDVFLAFPSLILALAFVAALGPGIENAVIAIALTSRPPRGLPSGCSSASVGVCTGRLALPSSCSTVACSTRVGTAGLTSCTVLARSAAEMPVVTPSAASIDTVKAVL
jgi:peptide/nickel transport system permease protein